MRKKRFIVEFSDDLDEVIDKLAKKQGLEKTQVVKQAVSLLNYVNEQQAKGRRLAIDVEPGRLSRIIDR
jgi:predicted transcriptional regulator